MERGDEDGARARIDRLAACLRLLDQIGWQQHGNRESYRVELDDDTARFIQRMGKVARRTLEDARRDLTVLRDPDEQATYYADVVETAWRLIDLDLDAISAAGIVRDALATANPNRQAAGILLPDRTRKPLPAVSSRPPRC